MLRPTEENPLHACMARIKSSRGFQEPTPVAAPSAPPSVASTPGNVGSDSSSITTQTPDNVIGETLVVQGRVEFQKLLRIDGHFEGTTASMLLCAAHDFENEVQTPNLRTFTWL